MVTNAKSVALRCVARFLAIAALCIATLPAAHAQATTPGRIPAPGASPAGPVKVGVYLFAIQELDFSKHSFRARFEVWFRWRGDTFDPLSNLHVVGARSQTVTLEDRRKLANGDNYAVARVDAVVNATFDTSAFPFERHRLRIEIESPYEDDYLVYELDRDASMLDPDAFSPGWRLSGFKLSEYRKQYATTFGLAERSNERYSTLVVEVVGERTSWRAAVDYFIGFIVCVLLCLVGYFVPTSLLQVRTNLATAATFAAIGNKYVVNSLTETSFTTPLVNVAVVTSFAMLLIFIGVSIRCEWLNRSGQPARAVRLNRNVGIGTGVSYGLLMAFFFWRALMVAPPQ